MQLLPDGTEMITSERYQVRLLHNFSYDLMSRHYRGGQIHDIDCTSNGCVHLLEREKGMDGLKRCFEIDPVEGVDFEFVTQKGE